MLTSRVGYARLGTHFVHTKCAPFDKFRDLPSVGSVRGYERDDSLIQHRGVGYGGSAAIKEFRCLSVCHKILRFAQDDSLIPHKKVRGTRVYRIDNNKSQPDIVLSRLLEEHKRA